MSAMATIKKVLTIDNRMIPSKIAYFIHGAQFGCYGPFINLFFISVGLRISQAGLITGVMFATPVITGPMWGYVTDKTGYERLILLFLTLGSASCTFSLPFIAEVINPCQSIKMNLTKTLNVSETACLYDTANNVTLFWTLLGVSIIASVFLLPLLNQFETIIMNVIKSGDVGTSFGAQRIFGSFGLSIANFLTGAAANSYSRTGNKSPYIVVFYIFLPITLLLFPIGCLLISQVEKSKNNGDKKNEEENERDHENASTTTNNNNTKNLHKDLVRFICRIDVVLFLTVVFISGLANSVFMTLSYVYVQDVMKRNKTEMTYILITATISEAAFFPFTSKCIKLLRGTYQAIIVGLLAHFVRFFIMSLDISYGVVVAVQTLSALGFSLSYSAFMEHVHLIAPERLNMTLFSIMMAIFHAGGDLVANMAGGKIYESFGPKRLFQGVYIMCLAFSGILVLYLCCGMCLHNDKRDEVIPAKGVDNIAMDSEERNSAA